MPGPVALVGAGEFLPSMVGFDRGLLAATGMARPRVAILPTASWPDGEEAFRRWAAMGEEHFAAIGAEVEVVLVRDRASAMDPANAQAVGEADVVYLSGGRPRHLLETLAGTPVWAAALAAHARGAVLAGCSAGAMVLAARQAEPRVRALPWPLRWCAGLGLVSGVAIFPHYDRIPEPYAALMALQAPRGCAILGIDEGTALVGRDGAWQIHGQARVTVWRGKDRMRHRAGEVFRL